MALCIAESGVGLRPGLIYLISALISNLPDSIVYFSFPYNFCL